MPTKIHASDNSKELAGPLGKGTAISPRNTSEQTSKPEYPT